MKTIQFNIELATRQGNAMAAIVGVIESELETGGVKVHDGKTYVPISLHKWSMLLTCYKPTHIQDIIKIGEKRGLIESVQESPQQAKEYRINWDKVREICNE